MPSMEAYSPLAASSVPLPPKTGSPSDPKGSPERTCRKKPDWYEKVAAWALEHCMRSYEAEVAGYKAELFKLVNWKNKNVLELGVGTGANFKYYASAAGLNIFGIDPNKQMENYARAAAVAAGLPSTNFSFMLAGGEALPVEDNSMDAVIGTLVLCSVEDVDRTLKEVKRVLKPGGHYLFIEHVAAHDGSLLRFMQSVLNPLQHFVTECHLTKETGKNISGAGFSSLRMDTTFMSCASLISPHVFGLACK